MKSIGAEDVFDTSKVFEARGGARAKPLPRKLPHNSSFFNAARVAGTAGDVSTQLNADASESTSPTLVAAPSDEAGGRRPSSAYARALLDCIDTLDERERASLEEAARLDRAHS